ncbi:hypothetical protein BDW59DRAFT_132639 [Aspergillus cavernicola]|uniref:Uncharacterized protein n=1 Tax=Aspergillus cavernicola TaxID=176166 RepID=A0ABR4HPJ9_9EURO
MALQQQVITGAMKDIITRIKKLIQDEKVTTEEKKSGGWKYGGRELETEIELLNAAMSSEYKVLECNAFHFINGANIRNPTKRLLMIPVNGTPKLKSGETLPSENCYYTDEGQLLFGERWDIILAALAEKDTP